MYQAGVDPIHFGIIFTVNLAIGMFMPPFGLNLFASHALFGTPLAKLYRGVLPFMVIYLVMLVLITYVPAITLAPLRCGGDAGALPMGWLLRTRHAPI